MSRLASVDPARDLALLFGVLLAVPLLVLAIVAIGGLCEALWERLRR